MPLRTIPETNTEYGLLCYDARGQERQEDRNSDGALMSQQLLSMASSGGFTDVFFFLHGWKGDLEGARDQYDRWIRSVDTHQHDRARAAVIFPEFRPLYIGLHWPSQPWGTENFDSVAFDAAEPVDWMQVRQDYLDRLGETPRAQEAVMAIFEHMRNNAASSELSPELREQFTILEGELDLDNSLDLDGMPAGLDTMGVADEAGVSFGDSGANPLLRFLCNFSYWTMKKRGRWIGESGMHDFLVNLQRATEAKRTRIHLMGHSFGTVVVSSMLGGPSGQATLPRPVDSVALVQGAVSLWSYADEIPSLLAKGPGYFHRILASGKHVLGPMIVTQSEHDEAVTWPYRSASLVSGDISFEVEPSLPDFGAIGHFGLRGITSVPAFDGWMKPATEPYFFQPGAVYNLNASKFIAKGDEFAVGAHNDIDGAEVAHAIWEAAFASVSGGAHKV